jgi:hypothetical protein
MIVSHADPRWRDLPEGSQLAIDLPEPATHGLVPHAELTVALAEMGFIVSASGGRLEARKTAVSIRGYRDGDEAAIRELFHQAFQHEMSLDRWQWRYRRHPLGTHRISVAVGTAGRLLGHYGGYPVALRRAGVSAPLLAHQNGDVMTAPLTRRLGHGSSSVVSRMAQHFWAAYGEGRADIHYGFNTGTARDLQRRVVPGVRALEAVQTWTADLHALAQPTTEALTVERIAGFDDEWDAFVDRVAAQYGLLACRDARSLNWRYFAEPGVDSIAVLIRASGRIVGGSVFRVAGAETRWGDALFDRDAPAAPARALSFLRALEMPPRLHGWFAPRPDWWARTLEGLGFRSEAEPRGLTLVYAPFTPDGERLMPELYYSWGDSDLF